jgi:hypothetical protein
VYLYAMPICLDINESGPISCPRLRPHVPSYLKNPIYSYIYGRLWSIQNGTAASVYAVFPILRREEKEEEERNQPLERKKSKATDHPGRDRARASGSSPAIIRDMPKGWKGTVRAAIGYHPKCHETCQLFSDRTCFLHTR